MKRFLVCCLLAVSAVAIGALSIKTWALLDTTERTIATLPDRIDGRLASIERTADQRLASLERTADRRLASVQRTADERLGSIQRDAVDQVSALRVDLTKELALTAETVRHQSEVLGMTYAGLPDRLAAATTQMWDCESNPDCLENRYVSVSRAVESAARAVDKHGAKIAAALEQTSQNSARTTEAGALLLNNAAAYFQPPPKWARSPWIQTPLYFGARLWPLWPLVK